MVRWDRGSLVVELYAPIIASEVAPAKMRNGAFVLTMRKMHTAKTWPSFERDNLGPLQNTPPPTYRSRETASSVDTVLTGKNRGIGAKLFALDIADAVGASNEPRPRRRRLYLSVYILLGDSTSDALLSSLTGGGLYHSGIEIEGVEYAFGGGPGGGSGVWRQKPRVLPRNFNFKNSSYKESLDMGMTRPLTPATLHRVIADMEHSLSWRKSEYNMLTHNWCVARKASQPPRERPAGQSCPPPPRALMIAPHHGSGCDAPT